MSGFNEHNPLSRKKLHIFFQLRVLQNTPFLSVKFVEIHLISLFRSLADPPLFVWKNWEEQMYYKYRKRPKKMLPTCTKYDHTFILFLSFVETIVHVQEYSANQLLWQGLIFVKGTSFEWSLHWATSSLSKTKPNLPLTLNFCEKLVATPRRLSCTK